MIDIVSKLLSGWFPELAEKTIHKVPCHKCVETGDPDLYEFKIRKLVPSLVAGHEVITKCKAVHQMKSIELVPDLM